MMPEFTSSHQTSLPKPRHHVSSRMSTGHLRLNMSNQAPDPTPTRAPLISGDGSSGLPPLSTGDLESSGLVSFSHTNIYLSGGPTGSPSRTHPKSPLLLITPATARPHSPGHSSSPLPGLPASAFTPCVHPSSTCSQRDPFKC